MAQEEWAQQQKMSEMLKETVASFNEADRGEDSAIPPEEEEEAGIDECLVCASRRYSAAPARWFISWAGTELELLFMMPDDDPAKIEASVSIQLDPEQALHLSKALRLHAKTMLLGRRTREDYSAG